MSGETITGTSAGIQLDKPETQVSLTVASTGVVYGSTYGVRGGFYPWTIDNQGVIAGSFHNYSFGINLYGGGSITNGSSTNSTAVISGDTDGILVNSGAATITNYGAIDQPLAVALGASITLMGGGTIINERNAMIEGHTGIDTSAGATIINDGTVEGANDGTLASLYPFPGPGIDQGGGGIIINNGIVLGGIVTSWDSTIFNGGSISSNTAGVTLGPGATLINAGAITGGTASVVFAGDDHLVVDWGSHFNGSFQFLGGGNALDLVAPNGTIDIYGFDTITVQQNADWILTGNNDHAINVTNFGTISAGGETSGAGLRLAAGGSVVNQASGAISGASYGAEIFTGTSEVNNYGTIAATGPQGVGVFIVGGGVVSNAAGASITGSEGVVAAGNATVTDNGVISGGVFVYGTGGVTNGAEGVIAGAQFGVDVGGGSVITNQGTIRASDGPAILTTNSYAAGVTLVNGGTISSSTGATAVDLAGGASRVVIDPDAVFNGNVLAQGTGNTLELAAGNQDGGISGIGSNFTGFGALTLDQSAVWTMAGLNTLAANSTISTGPGGSLTVAGSVQAAGPLTLLGNGTISVASTGTLEVGTTGGAETGSLTIDAGQTLAASGTLDAALISNGSLVATEDTTITGSLNGSGSAAIDPGVVLDISGQLGLASMNFISGGNETLALGGPGSVTSTISGFGSGDTIDLLHAAGTSDSFSFFNNTLTVTGSQGVVDTLDFAPGYSGADFSLATDQHNGVLIKFMSS